MLLGVAPLATYALTQIPGGASITLAIDKGDLTLTGQSVVLRDTMATAKGDLTLTGQATTFATVTAVVRGALTLTGQSTTFLVTEAISKGDLTLTGGGMSFVASEPVGAGQLTLTPYSVAFAVTFDIDAAALTLTGQNVLIGHAIPIEPGQLTLFGRDIDLKQIGGSSGRRKKGRTGFEPVIKRPPQIEKPEPRKVWTPPIPDRAPAIVLRRPLPELVDAKELPADLLGIQDQIFTAEDISDVERFLSDYDNDQQDADDIADILAILD
jgi:hypothetical protein